MGRRVMPVRPAITALCIAVVSLAACDEHHATQPESASSPVLPRIASLSPAISRTLVDIGLEDRLVGRSRFCRSVDPAIPVVGDLVTVDYETLIRLKPTHVLLQPPLAGLDPELKRLAAAQNWTLGVWPSLNGVRQIERLLSELPDTLYSTPSVESRETRRRVASTLQAMQKALTPADGRTFRGRMLILSGLEPLMAFGRDTYMHDIVTRLGAANAVSARGWVQLSFEDVARMNPEAMVLVLDTPGDDAPSPGVLLQPLQNLQVDAVRYRRLALLAHPDALLPSSGVVAVADAMRALLRQLARAPETAPASAATPPNRLTIDHAPDSQSAGRSRVVGQSG